MPLFLIPLAVEAIEAGVVLAESTAVRTAVVEAGSAIMSAEARQAAMTTVTTEGRALATHLATAEGRAALVDGVGESASKMTAEAASKGTHLWEATKTFVSESPRLQEAGIWAAKSAAKMAAVGVAIDVAVEKGGALMMEKMHGFFEGTGAKEADVDRLAKTATEFGVASNLSSDMKTLSGDISTNKGLESLGNMKEALEATRSTLPGKDAQIDKASGRVDALTRIEIAEIGAAAELNGNGKVSASGMKELKDSVGDAMTKADPASKNSLNNALDSLKDPHVGSSKSHFADAIAELSVAKDMFMKSIVQDFKQLTTDLAQHTEVKKEEMASALDKVTPAIVHKNDQEYAKTAEHSKSEQEHGGGQAAHAKQEVAPVAKASSYEAFANRESAFEGR